MAPESTNNNNNSKKQVKTAIILDISAENDENIRTFDSNISKKTNLTDLITTSNANIAKDKIIFATCKEKPSSKAKRLDKLDSKHKAIFSFFFKYLRTHVISKYVPNKKHLKMFRIPQSVVRKINISDMSKTLASNLKEIFGEKWNDIMNVLTKESPSLDFTKFFFVMLKPVSFHYLEYLESSEYKRWLQMKAKTKSKEYVDSLKALAETVIEYFFETPPNKRKMNSSNNESVNVDDNNITPFTY